jgi:FkbM family methyltransferase
MARLAGVLGGRGPDLIRRSLSEPQQYVALARSLHRYPALASMLKRYFLGGGSYPYVASVRTPRGLARITLHSHHDVWTVHELFCREDYRAGRDLGSVVDVGSNIGVSALYFLTRNATSRVRCFEPVPRNVERLRANLAGYEDRYVVDEAAVAPEAGTMDFGVEPSGRYGGLGVASADRISVRVRSIGDVLEEALSAEDVIDILKLDTEGAERPTVAAIAPEHLARIRTIHYETQEPYNPDPARFEMSFACETCTLRARS